MLFTVHDWYGNFLAFGFVDIVLLNVDIGGICLVDLTQRVARYCRDRGDGTRDGIGDGTGDGTGDGIVHVFAPHATAGLALMETGSGSEADLEAVLDRLLSWDDRYCHAYGSPGHKTDH